MPLLSAAAIRAVRDYATMDVPVPEWGGNVRVRSLSAHNREVIENGLEDGDNLFRARLIAMSLVDEEGNFLFADGESIAALGEKDNKPIVKLFNFIIDFNGLSKKSVDSMEKNSVNGQSEDLPSA